MKWVVVLAVLAGAVSVAGVGVASADVTGRLLVSTDRAGAKAAEAVVARSAAVRSGPQVPQIGLTTVTPPPGVSLRDLAERLRAEGGVREVAVERRHVPRFVPNDPALVEPEGAGGTTPGTAVQWWAQRLGLFEAWDVARGAGARVAVVDTGVDGRHPELAGKVVGQIDADPTPGHGGPLTDEAGHGTHVASLACAASNDGLGFTGAGGECGLIVAKTDFSDASVAQAIVEAADAGAHAINLSFGTDGTRAPPRALLDALQYATARGAVLVAAAADQPIEEQGDPANVLQPSGTGADLGVDAGLSVTAATASDQRAWFAGRGSQISLAAYGAYERDRGPRGLLAAWPQQVTTFERGEFGPPQLPPCRCRTTFRGDNRYAYLQGTSMATALVTAIAAQVRALNPDLPPADVVRLLKETARRPAGTGWNPELGWGIVDARAAVEAARMIDRRAPVSRLRARTASGRRIVVSWRGRDAAPAGVQAAGIDRYELWRSSYGRRPVRLLTTTSTRRVFRARAGGRYAFFTVAVDRAGNREPAPVRADAAVRIAPDARR